MTTPAQRHTLGALMDYLVAHEPKVHYAQRRPMRSRWITTYVELQRAVQSGAGLTIDCSESVTLLCELVGLNDPSNVASKVRYFGGRASNYHDYDGLGFTGTLLDSLPHYTDPAQANIGGLAVFGPGTGEHVVMVRHPGDDPVVFSHGWEGGPLYLPLSVERRYHHPGLTMLSIAKL